MGWKDYVMYTRLKKIDSRPEPYQFCTTETLWTDPYISTKMLEFHLDPDADPASRNARFIEQSVQWMARRFAMGKGVRVADFGCGPGLYTSRFARLGAEVTGIDFSERSLSYARNQADAEGLDITYVQQNYLDFSWPHSFDLITLIYCDFCALSPEQRRTLLSVFHDHLDKGGRVVLDVFSMAAFGKRQETNSFSHRLMDGFWSAGDYYGFMKTYRYPEEKVVLDKYTIVEPSRTWEVYNWLQYYCPETLERDMASSGFNIEGIYSDVAGTPYDHDSQVIAVVLGKMEG